MDQVSLVQRAIARWFKTHQRDLPWRRTRDPYRILVSEVMLQQTQVDRVIPKYRAFLRAFPTVRALAWATPREVILAWAGLGYNRRALYLWRAARAIVTIHGGAVPTNAATLQSLPGVGAYTAAAVATFATGQPHVLADTNVRRVVGRVFLGFTRPPMDSVAEHRLLRRIERTMPHTTIANTHPSLWGHAVMDFGALVCKAKPRCDICPLRRWCKAYPAFRRMAEGGKLRGRTQPRVPDRITRGKMLALVRAWDPRPVPLSALQSVLTECPPTARRRLLNGLVTDGLLAWATGHSVCLPGLGPGRAGS